MGAKVKIYASNLEKVVELYGKLGVSLIVSVGNIKCRILI